MRRIGAVRHRLRRTVEGNRHDHDREPGDERLGRIGVEAARDDGAETLAADQSRDHDHREGEQDRLVHRQQEHAAREWELHLQQCLRTRRAERLCLISCQS